MPRWHFLDFSVLCSVGLFFFFFVLRMRAFSLALKHQHHQKTRIETRRRDSTSLRPGRRTATMMMRKLDTKTRERERERKEERLEIFHPLCPLVAFLSFGRHFVCSHFFGFFKRGRLEEETKHFVFSLVSLFFTLLLKIAPKEAARVVHTNNTKRRFDEICVKRVVVVRKRANSVRQILFFSRRRREERFVVVYVVL